MADDHLTQRRRVQVVTRRAFSRREVLRALSIASGAAALGPMLAACGGSGGSSADTTASPGSVPGSAAASSGTGGRLKVSTWPAYVDKSLFPALEAAAGFSLDYIEDYNDNNEYFAKVQPQLSNGQTIDRDIVVPTAWMAARWIQLGWAEPLTLADIPNRVNLRPDLVKPPWDPTGAYTLPWANVATVVAYNRKLTGGALTGIADLFDPKYRGRVTLFSELRDTLGFALMADGADPAAFTEDQASAAFDRIERAKADGQVRAFTGNDYLQDLSAGNLAACMAYSGDIYQLSKENPDIVLLYPEEGALIETDVMVVPVTASNPGGAAAFMNYFYDPAVAARVTAETGYISPVAGVADELRKLGGEAAALADSPAVNPDEAQLARLKKFRPLSEDEEAMFDARFSQIIGA